MIILVLYSLLKNLNKTLFLQQRIIINHNTQAA
jgi:hypothetical protein